MKLMPMSDFSHNPCLNRELVLTQIIALKNTRNQDIAARTEDSTSHLRKATIKNNKKENMKKHLIAAAVASVVLVVLAYLAIWSFPRVFPSLAEEYYNAELFRTGSNQEILFFIHPIVLSFLLSWFWFRFKDQFEGPFIWRGIELGIVYGVVAILPAMLINYSIFNVSLSLVLCWLGYGVAQGVIAGIIYAKIDP